MRPTAQDSPGNTSETDHELPPIPQREPQDLVPWPAGRVLIDVRSADEFHGELGHIKGAQLHPLGPDLDAFLAATALTTPLAFVCRSGGRSAKAAAQSIAAGFRDVIDVSGGMQRWHELELPVEYA